MLPEPYVELQSTKGNTTDNAHDATDGDWETESESDETEEQSEAGEEDTDSWGLPRPSGVPVDLQACTTCQKRRSELAASQTLKACAKCQVTRYCSKACQKKDWLTHKKNCATPTNFPSSGLGFSYSREGQMIQQMMIEGLLHNIPSQICYEHLIDIYRLRAYEELYYSGHKRGLYNKEEALPDFQRFLDNAEKRAGLLPPWWSKQKRKECIELANVGPWSHIKCGVQPELISKRYKNWMMPMIFQQIGEKIEGTKAMLLKEN
jgi:mitochondrial splicing suppressor protein 51